MAQGTTVDPLQYCAAVAQAMGVAVTPYTVAALKSLADGEGQWTAGGPWNYSADFNPFNISGGQSVLTQYAHEANGGIRATENPGNGPPVDEFTDWQTGIQATADFIKNADPGIYSALQAISTSPTPQNVQQFFTAAGSSGSFGASAAGRSSFFNANLQAAQGQGPSLQSPVVPSAPPGQAGQPGQTYGQTTGSPGVAAPPKLLPGVGPSQVQLGEGTEVTLPGDATWQQAEAYIKQHYPTYSWLLNDPQIRNILEQAGKQNWSSTNVQAAVAQTDWWNKTNTSMRQWEELEHTDHATAMQKLSSMENDIVAAARGQSANLPSKAEIRDLATKALEYGWDQNQVSANIGTVLANGGGQTLDQKYLSYVQNEPGQLEFTNAQGGVQKAGEQVGQSTAADAAYHQAVEAARNANLADMPQSLLKSLAIQSLQAGPNWDWTSELNQVAGKGEGQTKYGPGVASAMFSTPQEFEFTGSGNTYYDKARSTLQQISADQGYHLTPQEILTAAQQAINNGAMDFNGGVSNQAQVQQILNRFSQVHQAPSTNPAYSSEAFSQPGMLQFSGGPQAYKGGSAADHALAAVRMALAGLPLPGIPENQMEDLARQAMKSGAINPQTGAVADTAQLAQILGPFAASHGAPNVTSQYLTEAISQPGMLQFGGGAQAYKGATSADHALAVIRMALAGLPVQGVPEAQMEQLARQAMRSGAIDAQTGAVSDSAQLAQILGPFAARHGAPEVSPQYLTQLIDDSGQYNFAPGANGSPDYQGATIADAALSIVRNAVMAQNLKLPESVMQSIALQGLAAGWLNPTTGQPVGNTLGNVIGQHAPQGQTLSAAYLTGAAANPGEYKFTQGDSQVTTADQMLTQVEITAANQQVDLSLAQAQEVAMRALKGGWSSAQIQDAIGQLVRATPPQPTTAPLTGQGNGQGMRPLGGGNTITTPAATTAQTNAPGLLQQLRTQAAQYLMAPSAGVLQQWGQNIASGTQDMQQFQAYLAQQASLKYPSMAQEIAQGITPSQITDNLQQLAAQTLDISPNQVNFINNPQFQKILDGGWDQGANGAKQANGQIMTYTQAGEYLRGLPQYADTTGARSSAADLATEIIGAFGRGP
jgi:hypothetical protein